MRDMKIYIFIVFIVWPILSYSQNVDKMGQDDLPNEIQDYYKSLNLVNSLSTTSEKSSLAQYLEDGNVKKAPSSSREFFIVELLKDVIWREINTQLPMPNKFDDNRQEASRILYEIIKWQKTNDFISITMNTSQISVEDNIKIIEYYETDKSNLDNELNSLSSPSFLAKEIHKWILINKKWYKKEVKIILTL